MHENQTDGAMFAYEYGFRAWQWSALKWDCYTFFAFSIQSE
jgi:hypothetical protein